MPWVALTGQSVATASASGSIGSESSLETAWRAESESLKSILTEAPQSKLGRIALVDALAQQIRNRMKVRLPNILSGWQGKSQVVQDELVRLGEQMVNSFEGTRAPALELCREFGDKFPQHFTSGEGAGWKIVTSFEGNFPNRIKQLPLDRHFDINNDERIVLEADGYQPYLISPEKGGGGETSVQPAPSQTVIDSESLRKSLVQPPLSQPIVDGKPSPNPINWAVQWQITILTLCFTTAIGIAIQSMEKEFQFPPSFHWLSLANLLTFSALFVAKFVGKEFPKAAKVLEQVAVFLAATIFFLAATIPLPPHFKNAAWAIYAVTMIIVFICKIL